MKHFGFGAAIIAAALCASTGAQPVDGVPAAPSAVASQQSGRQAHLATEGGSYRKSGGSPAQSDAPATPPMHVYIRAGLKSHGPGQHDYPQFLADWSKILTERNAVVDGSLHFPKASELEGVDVMVMYKGDAGGMTPEEKTTLENYLKRGGGLVSFHDTLCGPDPDFYSTIVGGAKKHGQTNFTLEADIPYTIVDKASPIMQGLSDFTIKDEAF